MGVLNLLHGEQGKATWAAIVEIAKGSPAQAAEIASIAHAVATNAQTMGALIASMCRRKRSRPNPRNGTARSPGARERLPAVRRVTRNAP